MSFPSTRTGKAKIQAGSGVRINYIDYWCEGMRAHIGETVSVRYDPFNRQVAYAFINKRWRKCLSTIHEFEGCTEKEMQLIAEGVRQRERVLHRRERVEIKQKTLARFRREAAAKQKELLQAQRRKDRETKRTYAFLEGSDGASATVEHPLPPEHPASKHAKTPVAEPKQAKTTSRKAPPQEESPDKNNLKAFRRLRV
jgi:putative transposase